MATGYKYSGARVKIDSASGTVTSGTTVVQEGFVGIALTGAASGAPFMIAIQGVWNIDVPASTVKGDFLYVAGANGAVTESLTPTITRAASNANTPFAKVLTDRDAAGKADVLLLPPGAGKAATQV